MKEWSSEQYLKFKKQRTQPAVDLAKRIADKDPRAVLDIGCGPGNSTSVLKKTFPEARVVGIDSSPEMIEKAKASCADIEFRLCDITADLENLEKYDVIFSNACLFVVENDVLSEPRWGFAGKEIRTIATLPPEEYFNILASCANDFDIWETVYYHRMPSVEAMVEWIKGTNLRPYLNALDAESGKKLEAEITDRAAKVYTKQKNEEYIFKFRRFFFIAEK